MNTILVDTNVLSFVFKGDTRANLYAPLLEGNRLAISFMTVAELFEWANTRKWGEARTKRLEEPLAPFLVVPVDIELCRVWGKLRAAQQAKGKTIASQDAWIAATALRHGLPLVTHNPSDFENIQGLEVHTALEK
ncbi:MAG: type II toxin-antitoxin system VapC family toxin [Chloroflexi bacterium]|nr:type II toxin-antitoxin system VapC family toxin [Chloroflexota bacterium]